MYLLNKFNPQSKSSKGNTGTDSSTGSLYQIFKEKNAYTLSGNGGW